MVRCPLCDAATVTVVLNSKPYASCSCCGATWIQEGSWQRSVRPGPMGLPDDVIALPEPGKRSRRRRRVPDPPPEEQAIAT